MRHVKVILREDVANVGDAGEVVSVRTGFARNFLIPQGKAKRATPENIKLLEEKRAELENAAAQRLASAQEQAAKIEGMQITISQKAGVDGRLFGSVTNVDIVDALAAKGVTVEKGSIRMPEGPLKLVGEFPLVVGMYLDVVANITVTVVAEAAAAS